MANESSNSNGNSTAAAATSVEGANALLPTELAFRQREAAIRAITVFREGQFDVNAACTRLFAALPQIKKMRPMIEADLRNFDLPVFDDLEARLHAAHFCNSMWLSRNPNKIKVADLVEDLDVSKTKLKETCEMLVPYGKVAPEQLKPIGEEGGYDGLINDVSRLLGILRRMEPETLNRTMTSPGELATIEASLLAFQGTLGKKQIGQVDREEASLLRQQSITYLLQSFDLALKAAIYFYGETEGKQIVPSPYADRGNRKSAKGDAASEAGETPAADAAKKPSTAAAEPFVITNPTGLPLTSPFEDDKK